jgi:aminoglycoside phosphotransferase (APT) family kinase protein
MGHALPPGLRFEAVSAWLREYLPGAADGGEFDFEIIGDGRSNITYRVTNGAGTWVLRRPPLGHIVATAHDMAREFKVLSGVAVAGFPAPRPIALCEDPSVNEHPFYVMEHVDGVIAVSSFPERFVETTVQREALSNALVDTLLQLHAIDYNAVGLGDFGRPEGYLERQVRRWAKQWEANKTRELPAIEELSRRLSRALPTSPAPTIVHGDYRLGNMILDRSNSGRVLAVLDWEMSTLGDPLADLGYTLVYWGKPAGPRPETIRVYAETTSAAGFASREEIIDRYARGSGRDVSAIDFYVVFAYYKLAVITEGIHRRNIEGLAVGRDYERYTDSAAELAHYALDLADRSEDPAMRG